MTQDSLTRNPFVGLRPFRSDESLLFFGRHAQTMELLQKLHETHFVAVVGGSGSGKSSLILAGLIPKLKAGFLVDERDRWLFATMRPGGRPLHKLVEAVLEATPGEQDPSAIVGFMDAIQIYGTEAILDKLAPALERSDANLFLLVDQFEEIFRFGSENHQEGSGEEAADFVASMIKLAEQRRLPIYVVMTMRSDFLGDCNRFYGLPEAMNRSQYLVPRLTRQQRKEAIEGPIRLYGERIAPRLLDRLLNEVGDDADQLPVLQHVLMRSWQNWQENKNGFLDEDNYEAVGTMGSALARHAEEAMTGMSEEERKLTEKMFQALTSTDEHRRHVRRPTTLSELQGITGANRQQIMAIIERFRGGGRSFLVVSEDKNSGDSIVDIAHESLIRKWGTLRGWVGEEEKSAQDYKRLVETAELHRQGDARLLRDPELQRALEWRHRRQPTKTWSQRYKLDFDLAMAFLSDSLKRIRIYMSLAIVFVILGLFSVNQFDLHQQADNVFKQFVLGIKDPLFANSNIVIVAADEYSKDLLENLENKPPSEWRQYHDDLIDILSSKKAKVVGFDVCFAASTKYDSALVESVKRAKERGTAVVLGVGCGGNWDTSESLAEVVDGLGSTIVVFREPLSFEVFGDDFHSFALEVVQSGRKVSGTSDALAVYPDAEGYIDIKLVPNESFETLSYYDVVDGEEPESGWAGKTAVVGFTLPGLDEFEFSPSDGPRFKMHGVFIHANAINTLMAESRFSLATGNLQVAISILLVVVTSYLFWRIRAKLKRSTLLALLEIAVFTAFAVILFKTTLIVLPIALPVLAILLTALLVSFLAYAKLLPGMVR